MFSKILIANRGEIAVRIIRACKEMGISTVAVFSEADRDALHVSLADESVCIGPAPVQESYLNMTAIISAAVATKAEAIHPGYGLLSENARFAELCQQCHIAFIGPSAEVISKMGDKDIARKTMMAANVPVIPGCDVIESVEEAHKKADEIGYPLLVKARSGGGGRGIRKVERSEDFETAFLTASSEAEKAFGDGGVYMEKFLYPAKHIEMQLLCDQQGNVVALGERECSVQRKNQKLIEESPANTLTPETRKEMIEVAVRAAKAAKYTSVGTIEFLMDKDGKFYFMEMNTRLQVEHSVTEMVTNVDIVKWQIRIACQIPLDFTQEDIHLHGHSMECRINAKSTGQVDFLHVPGGSRVHFDTALVQDCLIVPFYDSMIGKLIVYAKTREDAIRKMEAALCEMVIHGIQTNIEDQLRLVRNPRFQKGEYDTLILPELLAEGGTELE